MSNINYFLQIKKRYIFKILPVLTLSFLKKCGVFFTLIFDRPFTEAVFYACSYNKGTGLRLFPEVYFS